MVFTYKRFEVIEESMRQLKSDQKDIQLYLKKKSTRKKRKWKKFLNNNAQGFLAERILVFCEVSWGGET